MNLKGLKNRFKNFLESENGKKLIYEIKSFIMTFIGVLISLLAIDPVINNFIKTGIIDISLFIAIWASLTAAFGRSIVIYLGKKLKMFDYRADTKNY